MNTDRLRKMLAERPHNGVTNQTASALCTALDEAREEAAIERGRATEFRDKWKAKSDDVVRLTAERDTFAKRFSDDRERLLTLWGELWRLADARGDSTGLAHDVADRGRAYVDTLRAERDSLAARVAAGVKVCSRIGGNPGLSSHARWAADDICAALTLAAPCGGCQGRGTIGPEKCCPECDGDGKERL